MSNHDELSGENPGHEAALKRKVFALLTKTLAADFPMHCLYDLVCKQAVINRRASSAPRPLVEALVRQSSPVERKSIQSGLFKFFVADGDFVSARKYLPKKGKETFSEYYPLMIWSLNTRQRKTAARIYNACWQCCSDTDYEKPSEDDDFVFYQLASAVALYEAAKGQHAAAIETWGLVPASDPEYADARANIVSARVVDALLATRDSLNLLLEKQTATLAGPEAADAGEHNWRLDAVVDRLTAVETGLLGMLSPADLQTFRIELFDNEDATEEDDR